MIMIIIIIMIMILIITIIVLDACVQLVSALGAIVSRQAPQVMTAALSLRLKQHSARHKTVRSKGDMFLSHGTAVHPPSLDTTSICITCIFRTIASGTCDAPNCSHQRHRHHLYTYRNYSHYHIIERSPAEGIPNNSYRCL